MRGLRRLDLGRGRWRPAVCLAAGLAACSGQETNFSQYPGFAEWYAAHPPDEELPGPAERALLERYKPRLFLPEGHEGPIDFYGDYIAQGRLYDAEGRLISDEVTREMLNAHRHDPRVVFEHEPADAPPRAVIYGRIDRETLPLPRCASPPIPFLTYHLVFRTSGLPAALPRWKETLLGLVTDLDDWHQLDHYTSLTLALAPGVRGDLAPFAVTFQHHNYLRTWLLGEEPGPGRLQLPADGRLAVDVAIRSNELYPHDEGATRRRAVSFMDPDSARYLVSGENPPWRAADDITAPAHEIDPELAFLPPSDAFYVFQGWLGEKRLLPGRSGPPGADYNTLPAFKPKVAQLAAFYWREDDPDYLDLLGELSEDGRPGEIELERPLARFLRDLEPIAPEMVACGARLRSIGASRTTATSHSGHAPAASGAWAASPNRRSSASRRVPRPSRSRPSPQQGRGMDRRQAASGYRY